LSWMLPSREMRRPFWSWFRSRWNWNWGIKDSAAVLASIAGSASVAMVGNGAREESSELRESAVVLPLQLPMGKFSMLEKAMLEKG